MLFKYYRNNIIHQPIFRTDTSAALQVGVEVYVDVVVDTVLDVDAVVNAVDVKVDTVVDVERKVLQLSEKICMYRH